jgi:endonuclease/exonuclease/phosphatase family metal-dependent hydrolase
LRAWGLAAARLAANPARVIRVASYNIHKAIGTDRLRRPQRTLDVICEIAPEIVALQEADRRFGARVSALPLDMIAECGFKPVDFDTRADSIGWHGNSILVRKAAKVVKHGLIVLPTFEPRGAVFAELVIAKQTIRVVGMHLDLSGLWRRRQIRAIIDAIALRPAMPTVMMGDLNEWSPHGGSLVEFHHDYRIAHSTPSFHARRPVGKLDRIVVGSGLRILASGTHHSAKSRRASDHLPVWAELEFSGEFA